MTLLDVSDLRVTFPTETELVRAVRGMSYQVDKGEVVALVGESGSGKSANAMAVVGLLPDYAEVSGSVRLAGEELIGMSDSRMSQIRGNAIGTVFQDPMSALTPVYTVGDQIAEAVEVHQRSMTRRAARARAVELLDLVGIAQPEQRAGSFPHELSGGERQRVVIAIAIANDPDLLICDEPTTALDVTVQAQILEVLKTARDVTGAGVLIITHDLGVVAEFADRAVVMYAGRAVENAPVQRLYHDRVMPYTVGLLGSVPRLDAPQGARLVPIPGTPPSLAALPPGCPFAPRCPLVIDDCRKAEPPLFDVGPQHGAACIRVDEVEGRSAADIYGVSTAPAVDTDAAESPVVVRVRDLVKTYRLTKGVVLRRQVGEVRAVDGISFDLHEGRTLGIVGESGSGKSTTLHEVLALTKPQSGSIEVLGVDVATLDAASRRQMRGDLQVVFQDPVASLDPRLPVFDVLAEPLQANGFDKERIDGRVAELLELVGMRRTDAGRYPSEFSGGQKQRIGIARALALQPKILLLDEPVSALDVSIQAGIINLLLDLQQRFGLSYLFVSHDLSVVKHLAHRVAVMHRGTIVEQGDTDEVFRAPQHEYTRKLLAAVPQPEVAPSPEPSADVPATGLTPRKWLQDLPNRPADTDRGGPPPRTRSTGRRIAVAAAVVIVALVAVLGISRVYSGSSDNVIGAAEIGTTNDINPQDPSTLRDGGMLRVAIGDYPPNFNPLHIDGNTVDTAALLKPMLPRAYRIAADGSASVNTDYFTSIELTSTSPQVVTYTINPQAVWSDGTPITWEDIASQINATNGKNKDYAIAAQNGSDRVASVTRGVDDRQAVMTFSQPYSEWKGMFASSSMLVPKTMTENPEVFNKGYLTGVGKTAGPFVVDQLDRGNKRITLKRNPLWWSTTPRLDGITYLVLDPAAEMPALQNNAIDAIGVGDVNEMTIARRTPGIVVRRAPGRSWYHFTFSGKPGSILADPALRRAVARGINRQAIAEVSLRGLANSPEALNNHIYVRGQEGYQDNSGVVAYDPEQAKRDLDALGWRMNGPFRMKDGRPLVIRNVLVESPSTRDIGVIAQNSLAQIGVRLELDVRPATGFFTDYVTVGNFDITQFGWSGDAFPLSSLTQIYRSTGESNFGKIGSPEIDALIEETISELDAEKARDMANRLDKMLFDEVFSLPLTQSPGNIAVRDTLANYGAFGLADANYTAIGFTK